MLFNELGKPIYDFFAAIDPKSDIVLSIDLDNTLVNRSKGDNYIFEDTLELLELMQKEPQLYIVPNTGRDVIGFNSLISKTIDFPDAILGAGSLIKVDNKYIFDSNSEIDGSVIKLLLGAVDNYSFPFVDFTHKDGRLLVYNDVNGLEFKNLFFSQNPRAWFGQELPPAVSLGSLNKKDDEVRLVYRIEFPVLPSHSRLHNELANKLANSILCLAEVLAVPSEHLRDYTVKRKAFFNDEYKGKLCFARFEKHTEISSKGHGIKRWLEEKKLCDPTVIHVGDQDYGVVDDTLVKKELPQAKLIMVGDRCQKDNLLVDLYLIGDTDTKVNEFIRALYAFIKA